MMLSTTISKTFRFAAAHSLPMLPDTHKCHRKHGHNYEVTVELGTSRVVEGFVLDYGELAPLKEYLDTVFDHRDLNDIIPNPTAEVLAFSLWTWCDAEFTTERVKVTAVTVAETPNVTATYRPPADWLDDD